MIPALKAEFRKLVTVRSTYFWTFGIPLLIAVVAFWPEGLNLKAISLKDPTLLANDITQPLAALGIFATIVPVLLMANEYRHNTILYTLTATNNRLKALFAKFIVVSFYGMFFASLVAIVSPLATTLGIHLAGHTMAAQTLAYHDIIWHVLFFGWGMAVAGLLLATLIRSQVGAIVAAIGIPAILEGFLVIVMKGNTKYLPFTALRNVVDHSVDHASGALSASKSVLVFLAYLVVGWLVATWLFLKRDAN